MKSFKEFNEAISAARLAQLAAKGKGGAASAKMKADGLKPAQPQNKPMTPAPKFTRPNPAATKRNTGSVKTVAPGTGMPSSMGGRSRPISMAGGSGGGGNKPPTRPQAASKGGAIVKAKNNLPAAPKPKMSSALATRGKVTPTKPSRPDEKQAGKMPGTFNDKAAKQRKRILNNKRSAAEKRGAKKLQKGFGNILRQTANQVYNEPQENKGNLSGGRVTGEVR